MVRKVAVLGGGVIGMTSAVVIAEGVQDVEVTLISHKWSPDTTGDGSAGCIWMPYQLGDVPRDILRGWCKKSFQTYQDIYMSPQASEYGVGLCSTYSISTEPMETLAQSDMFLKWHPLTSKEFTMFPNRYRYGAFLTTFFAECTKLLPALLKRFQKKGGKILEKKVENMKELAGLYDVVINCTGLGARELVPDLEVKPVRGQVIRVHAPWVKHGVMANDDDFYILPNSEEVIVGGTHQKDDWNLEPDPEDRRKIWEECTDIMPSLKGAKVIRDWVGLRPFRPTPRVEREVLDTEKGKLKVIHNYGHSGCGVSLSWGCAHHVLQLLQETLGTR